MTIRTTGMAAMCWLWLCGVVLAQGWVEVRGRVPEPAAEFRAAWIATVHNLDWPSKRGMSEGAQKRELAGLLDLAASLRLNAVILQVRPAGDALYASRLEPWSAVLTGTMGASPGYDPLAFAVDEAHRRGLELHAWVNPFRALTGSGGAAKSHISRRHPEWMRPFAGQTWMDPGEPGVQAHTLAVVRDILRRYDVDGIHIDDYFYPYPVEDSKGRRRNIAFPDEGTWRRHGRGQDRGDWRRDNINRFVRAFYGTAKETRRAAKVGISPFGIWRPGVPDGIEARLDAVRDIHADSRLWLRSGWCDYFTPQLYWPIEPRKQSYSALLAWWRDESRGRPVWPGIAANRIGSGHSAAEVVRQVDLARRGRSPGAVHWSIKALRQDRGGVSERLRRGPYAEAAVPPAMPWLGGERPDPPDSLSAGPGRSGTVAVSWQGRGRAVRWWVVQVRRRGQWQTAAVRFRGESAATVPADAEAVAVRALSASGIPGAARVLERR